MSTESLEMDLEPTVAVRTSRWGAMRDYHLLVPNIAVRMANTMSTSALPLLMMTLGFPSGQVGYLVSFGGLTSMIMNLIGGTISDYFCKRRLMLAGIVGVGVSTALLGVVSKGWHFIGLRLLQGAATGFFRPTSQALAYDVNPKRRAYILGLLGSSYVLGNAAGPALGGCVSDLFGLRSTMFVAGLLAACASLYVVAVYRFLPNPARARNPLRTQLMAVIKRNPTQSLVSFVVVIADAWILSSWNVYLPIYLMKHLQASYTQIGLFVGLESAIYVLAQPLAGRVIDRCGVRIPLVVSMLGHGVLIACTPLFNHVLWILICLVIVGVLNSAANPASVLLTARLSKPEDRGLCLGLLSSASNFGQFIGPVVSGSIIVATHSEAAALIACIVPGVVGAVAPLLLKENSATSPEKAKLP